MEMLTLITIIMHHIKYDEPSDISDMVNANEQTIKNTEMKIIYYVQGVAEVTLIFFT